MLHVLRETVGTTRRVFALCEARHKWLLAAAVLLMLVTGALAAFPPMVVGAMLDNMLQTDLGSFATVVPYLLVIVGAVIGKELLTVLRKWVIEDICTRLQQQQTVALVAHLLRVDISFFMRHCSGALNGRMHRSVEGLIRLLKLCFLDFFPAAFTAGWAFAVAAWTEPIISGIMVLGVVIGFGLILWQVASQRGVRIALLRERESLDGTVVETLGGIEIVRAANTGDIEASRVNAVAERLRRREIRHHIQMAVFDAAKCLAESAIHIAVLSASVWLAVSGRISVGMVMTFSMLYLSVALPLRELHRILDEAHESTLRVLDLFDLYAHSPDRSFLATAADAAAAVPSTASKAPAIELSHVRYSYPDANGSGPALDDLCLRVEEGEHVGIVGRTGCGKTTLTKLLLRLLHCDCGTIRFCGLPIEALSREMIAAEFGYVSQHPFLRAGSIFDNIAYSRPGATLAEVQTAARRANIHDEIVHELGGYGARLAERGANVAGGQRQRLILARLFLQNPHVILLDEATSALDNRTEAIVQQSLDELMTNRTTLIIAHRLNTLRNVDRVVVMEHGRVIEEGRYSELLCANSRFAEMHRSSLS